jgi:hypothetical protein
VYIATIFLHAHWLASANVEAQRLLHIVLDLIGDAMGRHLAVVVIHPRPGGLGNFDPRLARASLERNHIGESIRGP